MSSAFLQRLLDEGHLRDLGEDATRFDFLAGAVRTLSEFLSSKIGRAEVIPFTIVGVDPETPPDDPVFDRVTEAIVNEWPTYPNVYRGDRPRQLLRMVALAAIESASTSDGVAAAAWYTASNWFSLGPTPEGALGDFVARLGLQTENEALELWRRPSMETSFRMPSRTLAAAKPIQKFALKKDLITEDLKAAVDEGIVNLSLNNGRYGQNNPQAWVEAMAPKLASVILSAAASGGNVIVDRINEAGLVSAEGMKEFAASIGDKVREALVEAESAASGRDLRSDLLWWRQSLYSPSNRGSYRDFEPYLAVLIMAFDLHGLVPRLTPHSVEFILRETACACGLDAEISLADLVVLARNQRRIWAESYPRCVSERPRRSPLLTVALAEHGSPEEWLGRSSSASLSAPDAAVWVFRELQASRVVRRRDA